MFVRQQYRREYGKGLPHKKPIASETDARKTKSFARLGGLKEAPASIGGEYFTKERSLVLCMRVCQVKCVSYLLGIQNYVAYFTVKYHKFSYLRILS